MAAPAAPSSVISVRDLRVQYGDREVLHGLAFDIVHGETVVVIGGSGSGKSTLLRTLVGLEKPSSGEVRVKGVDIAKASAREMDAIRKKIGLAFQGGALIGSLSVGENIALALLEHTPLKPTTIEVMVRIKLEQVGLSGFENYSPSQLSGGMRKRAAFARAMAMDPEILFFDEPSAGLDPITAAGIDDLILDLKKAYSMTMVVVTHELASAFLIADRIILIDRGNIVAMGPAQEVRDSTHPRVRQFLDRVADTTQDDDVDHMRMYTEGLK
ncbi:MAG TPA: ATP-binding cassette domain-containing protein [Bryobacteraceae bacterium]|jgi:phospholipid/cholesterol/gamma-HCH transport system ATP-binding protein|nr:ATP-binding cassette domain-containing protein [Bryobacteraceae bacterium]